MIVFSCLFLNPAVIWQCGQRLLAFFLEKGRLCYAVNLGRGEFHYWKGSLSLDHALSIVSKNEFQSHLLPVPSLIPQPTCCFFKVRWGTCLPCPYLLVRESLIWQA